MSEKSDYTQEEWFLLHGLPGMVGIAVLGVDESGLWGTTKETFAISKEWALGVYEYPDNALIKSLLTEKTGPDGEPMKDAYKDMQAEMKEQVKQQGLENFINEIVDDCGKAADVLDAKSSTDEAAEYKAWVMAVGQKVAATAKEKDAIDGGKVSEKEEALLKKVAEALQV
jgi:phage terminase small subunit